MMRDYRPDMEARDARRRLQTIRETALMLFAWGMVLGLPAEWWPW